MARIGIDIDDTITDSSSVIKETSCSSFKTFSIAS